MTLRRMLTTCGIIALTCSAHVAEGRGELVQWSYSGADPVEQVLPAGNGTVLLLFRRSGVGVLSPGEESPTMLPKPPHVEHCLGIFPGRTGEEGLLLAGYQRGLARVLAWREGGWQTFGSFPVPKDLPGGLPVLGQDSEGAVWFMRPDGTVCRVLQGKCETARCVDATRAARTPSLIWEFRLIESKDGTVWIHPAGEEARTGHAGELLAYRKGEWVRQDIGRWSTRAACAARDGGIYYGSQSGIGLLDPVAKRRVPNAMRPPTSEFFEYRDPVFIRQLPDGVLIALWQRTPKMSASEELWRSPQKTELAEYRKGGWHIVSGVGDRGRDGWEDGTLYQRPCHIGSDGEVLLGLHDNVFVHRSKQGRWTRLDWRAGILPYAYGCRLDGKRNLWINSGTGACVSLNLEAALAAAGEGRPGTWRRESLQSGLARLPSGHVAALTDKGGGALTVFGQEGAKEQLLPKTLVRRNKYLYLAADSAGGLWLLGEDVTGHYDGERVQVFKPDSTLKLDDRELALQAQIWRGSDFRIGRASDVFYPILSDDGRIVFKSDTTRMSHYNGRTWDRIIIPPEAANLTAPAAHPFFHGDEIVLTHGDKSWQLVQEKGRDTWVSTAYVRPPFALPDRDESVLPAGCPIAEDARTWVWANDIHTWVGTVDRVAWTSGSQWVTIESVRSPLFGGMRVLEVVSDANACWWFSQDNGACALYQGKRFGLSLIESELRRVKQAFSPLPLPLKCGWPADDLVVRARVDHGPWLRCKPEDGVPLDILDKGKHRLQIEAFSRTQLARSNRITTHFQVVYERDSLIQDTIKAFGSDDFRVRRRASENILRFGPAALPALKAALKSQDPEVVERARKAIDEIEKEKQTQRQRPARRVIGHQRALPPPVLERVIIED